MSSRGVLMMAWGSRAYGYAAHNLALSIRHHSPRLPISILIDADCRKGLRDESLFENITIMTTPHDPALMKMQVYDLLPYDHTLFMDVDGMVLNPLEPLFDLLEAGGDYRCHVHAWYTKDSPDMLPMMVWATRPTIWNHYGFTDEKLPATQSSLQYIRKGAFCENLFGTIQSNYANRIPVENLRNKWGGGQPDELYLNVTLAQLGYDPSLPNDVVYWGDDLSLPWKEVKSKYYLLSMFGTAQNIKKPYVMGYNGDLSKMNGRAYEWSHIAGNKIANKAQNPMKANDGLGRSAFAKRFFKEEKLPDTNPIEGAVNLMVSYFQSGKPDRQKELDECMEKNIANPHITKIYNLSKDIYDHPKVINLTQYNRPTYQDFIEEANLAQGAYTIIANADMYFDDTLLWLDKVNMDGAMIALCRYDMKRGRPDLFAYAHSQDSWMFKGRIKLTGCDYQQGKPGCDNRIAYDALRQGYRVMNPAKDIKTYHLHESNERSYTQDDRLIGGYQPILITSIMDLGKNKRLLIKQPGKVGDIIICLPIARWYGSQGYSVHWLCPEKYHPLFTGVDYAVPVSTASGFYDHVIDIGFGLDQKSPSQKIWMSRRKDLDSFVTLKYELAGVPISESHNLHYKRDEKKEQELFDIVITNPSMPYALVHNRSDYGDAIDPDTDLAVIQFSLVEGYTIFHWAKIIERAAEIHCIDSCLLNFADRLTTIGDLFYYPNDRVPEQCDRTLIRKQWKEVVYANR